MKGRISQDVGSLNDADQNNYDSDDDYDDNIEIDNFKEGYDDGFEDIFEELDFEDEDDDHTNRFFAQNNSGEFWIAGPFPIQHGLDEVQTQPW